MVRTVRDTTTDPCPAFQGLHLEERKLSLYNVENLDKIKHDFYRMVEDKWTRDLCHKTFKANVIDAPRGPWTGSIVFPT